MKTETPTQEQYILSIEDRAKEYVKEEWQTSDDPVKFGIEVGFITGANEMLLIIKELGEALKEIQEANTGGVINTHWMQNHIQTTLDKYKQYL
jgi:hypothetical protein